MAHEPRFDPEDPILARVTDLALALPGARSKVSHGLPAFYTAKVFAYYGGSIKQPGGHIHHPHSLLVLPADDRERTALLAEDRCFHPAYLGPYGWVGVDLDVDADWAEVAELLEDSYRRTAPRALCHELDARGTGPAGRSGQQPSGSTQPSPPQSGSM